MVLQTAPFLSNCAYYVRCSPTSSDLSIHIFILESSQNKIHPSYVLFSLKNYDLPDNLILSLLTVQPMIWFIVLVCIGFVGSRFWGNPHLVKPQQNVLYQNLPFQHMLMILDQAAFNGRGQLSPVTPGCVQLSEEGSNQQILFFYGKDQLTIKWTFRYFQRELVHSQDFHLINYINDYEQELSAHDMIQGMAQVVQTHEENFMTDLWEQIG